jgi:hypothetical protein
MTIQCDSMGAAPFDGGIKLSARLRIVGLCRRFQELPN